MTHLLPRVIVVLALLLFFGRSANADLLFVFDEAVQQGLPGTTLTFSGTLTNTGEERVYLNAGSLDLVGEGLTGDSSPFFDNSPLFLEPFDMEGSSWSGGLFHVEIASASDYGTSEGAFTVFGGVDSSAFNNLVSSPFLVQVVPAPSSVAAFLLGIVPGIAFMLRRRK